MAVDSSPLLAADLPVAVQHVWRSCLAASDELRLEVGFSSVPSLG